MDPNRALSLGMLLFLSLAFELSFGTGAGMRDCSVIIQRLGDDTWLPLMNEHQINKSFNKSIRILVTMGASLGSKTNKKIMSFDLTKGGYPDHLEDGYQFQPENLSLRILGNRRESEGWYFVSLEENVSVQQFCMQLKLYEQVSSPEIKVLNKTQDENGTCSLMLACTVKKGDHVTYSWSDEAGIHLLSPANRSHLLYVTLSNKHHGSMYNCTASNPVSNRSRTFNLLQECTPESSESRSWIPYTAVSSGIFIIIILVLAAIIMLKKQGKKTHCQPPMEEKGLTIYAQVQKSGPLEKKLHDNLKDQDPCTTIYVAATEPALESVQETNPTTVYASVTLPES
ncbi:signaling lymphocytic activation molecule [Sigmodon hispidus]|uniref:Signaling lymphocytic activation molecule 1 n=1 Tax=Sigmodon hispidus TaxID=42415 RepID=T1QDM4_SIGHI|nr:signaling lymphocytic activation molecule family member 1 [Sigmodon hispidus]UWY64114.1 signaling lymphocytic activation molecule 1 [Sigmodon hispidus]